MLPFLSGGVPVSNEFFVTSFLDLMRLSVKEKRLCKGTGCNCFLQILPQPRTLDVNNSHLTAGAILTRVTWRGGMFSFGLGIQHFRGKITI